MAAQHSGNAARGRAREGEGVAPRGSIPGMRDDGTPRTSFWQRGRPVAVQVSIAVALAIGIVVMVNSPVAWLAAALLIGSALLRLLGWHLGRRGSRP